MFINKSIPFFVPIHLLPVILFNRSKEAIWKFIKNTLRSALFVAFYTSSFRYSMCLFKNAPIYFGGKGGSFSWQNVSVGAFLAGLWLFIEAPWRRTEIILFFLPRIMPVFWNWCLKWNWVKPVPYGEVFLFAFGMAVIMYFYQSKPKHIKKTYHLVFKFFLGEN